ncbi:MAG: hypothetical protein LQ352_000998 [Teloschistes flavicans]|nr:MAG: hypothetical protein LQ352_000998 [Teloschistes flavicans]
MSAAANRMAAKVADTATKAAGKAAQAGSSGGQKKGGQTVLQKGARKDPELYVLIPGLGSDMNACQRYDRSY